ncbi:MAG: glycosyltransferase family 39 protein [Candidatus Eremiobacteraeota bacterium]|nr:glycosyltransferase family 39 protein [Candidatus Eremiobacteraeota bacterium]MBV8365824.1 glycosyltransferase family 39 protein [Candidatus Eremiobacteraeota bacterium]
MSFLPAAARYAALVTFAAGASAGFFAWYVIASRAHAVAGDLGLLACIIAGGVGALAVWALYSKYVGRWADVEHEMMLQVDALSYLPFFALWLYVLQVPGSIGSASFMLTMVVVAWLAIKLAVLAYFVRTVRLVSSIFLATRIPLILIASVAAIVIGQRAGHHWSPQHGLVLDVWSRWDAQHYLDIAQLGYHGIDIAFFPLYPLLIHVLGKLIGDNLIAGLIISNVAFFVALGYLYALTKKEFGDDSTAFHAIFYTAIFPTAIFFSAVYTESLFLALTVASVYYARRGNFITSGVVGALAALTRVEGVLVALPLLYEVWRGWREGQSTALLRGIIGLSLVPAGLLVYMTFLYALVGDPMAFQKIQVDWNRHLSFPWVSIANTLKLIVAHPLSSPAAVNHIIELVFTLAFLALMIVSFWVLRPSYSLYFAASLLVPMSTASLMSMPRFALVVFPAFMLLALWGRRPVINSAIVSLFLPLLGLFTVLFADWYWLA